MKLPNLQFVCREGCGVCTVRLADFEYHREETMEGEMVTSKVVPQIVSACCGRAVEIYDNRLDRVVATVGTILDQEPA